jgi:hypothetical protein
MDTTTVLEIIRLIETYLANHKRISTNGKIAISKEADRYFYHGLIHGLTELENHLQEYIEQQVTYAENNLGNGE